MRRDRFILTHVRVVSGEIFFPLLRGQWQRVIDVLGLEPKTNGRISNMQEMVDLLSRALVRLIEQERKFNPSSDKGFLTPKEFLELYLRRRK